MVHIPRYPTRAGSPRATAAAAVVAVGAGLAAVQALLPFRGVVPALTAIATFAALGAAVVALVGAHHPHRRFGWANAVTLVRGGGVAGFAGLAAEPAVVNAVGPWLVFAAAVGLLALDGTDGWLARRERLESGFGARFDLEVDAFFILVLAALALGLGKAGPWVLGIGLMRYGFLAGGLALPWLAAPLPPSRRRKAVCAGEIAALAALLVPPVGPPVSQAVAAAAFASLAWSFAVDIQWLARRRAW